MSFAHKHHVIHTKGFWVVAAFMSIIALVTLVPGSPSGEQLKSQIPISSIATVPYGEIGAVTGTGGSIDNPQSIAIISERSKSGSALTSELLFTDQNQVKRLNYDGAIGAYAGSGTPCVRPNPFSTTACGHGTGKLSATLGDVKTLAIAKWTPVSGNVDHKTGDSVLVYDDTLKQIRLASGTDDQPYFGLSGSGSVTVDSLYNIIGNGFVGNLLVGGSTTHVGGSAPPSFRLTTPIPAGVRMAAGEYLFIASPSQHKVFLGEPRNSGTAEIAAFAGTGTVPSAGDPFNNVAINNVSDFTVTNNVITSITGSTIDVSAFTPTNNYPMPSTSLPIDTPSSIAVLYKGPANDYVAFSEKGNKRLIIAERGKFITVPNQIKKIFKYDASNAQNTFDYPAAMAFDNHRNLFVAENEMVGSAERTKAIYAIASDQDGLAVTNRISIPNSLISVPSGQSLATCAVQANYQLCHRPHPRAGQTVGEQTNPSEPNTTNGFQKWQVVKLVEFASGTTTQVLEMSVDNKKNLYLLVNENPGATSPPANTIFVFHLSPTFDQPPTIVPDVYDLTFPDWDPFAATVTYGTSSPQPVTNVVKIFSAPTLSIIIPETPFGPLVNDTNVLIGASTTWFEISGGTGAGTATAVDNNNASVSNNTTGRFQYTLITTGLVGTGADQFAMRLYNSFNSSGAPVTGDLTFNRTIVSTAPTALTATAISQTKVTLNWTAPAGITTGTIHGYNIYRKLQTESAFPSTLFTPTITSGTTFTDSTAAAFTAYTYKVVAQKKVTGTTVEGTPSTVNITTPDYVPSAPVQVTATATATSPTQITLTWDAVTNTVSTISEYRIYRADGSSGTSFSQLNSSTTITAPTYSDTTVTPFTAYSYKVSAVNTDNPPMEGQQSAIATATTPDLPPPNVGAVTATVNSSTSITITWNMLTPGLSGLSYNLKKDGVEEVISQPTTGTTVTATHTGLAPYSAHTYEVRAVNGDSSPTESTTAATAAATTEDVVPATPTGLTAATGTAGVITLSWTVPTPAPASGISGYKIYSSQGTGSETLIHTTSGTGVTYSNSGLPVSTGYTYTVTALNSETTPKESLHSLEASATTLPAPPPPPTAVADSYTLTYTKGTPLPLTVLGTAANGLLANDTNVSAGAGTIVTVTTPSAGGTVTGQTDGSFTYTPDPAKSATYTDTFTYTVTTSAGSATATATITVTITDPLPVANADAYAHTYVLGTTTPLTIAAATGLLANDQNLTGVTTVTTAAPSAGGTVTGQTDGSFTYTPDPAKSATYTDTFTYTVTTSSGSATATATITVTITAAHSAPPAGPFSPQVQQFVDTVNSRLAGNGSVEEKEYYLSRLLEIILGILYP